MVGTLEAVIAGLNEDQETYNRSRRAFRWGLVMVGFLAPLALLGALGHPLASRTRPVSQRYWAAGILRMTTVPGEPGMGWVVTPRGANR